MGEPGEGRDMQERPGAGLPVSLSPGLLISLSERCAAIELLVLDVDGVLTDGAIVYTDNGVEVKAFHVRDGSALKLWQLEGKRAAVISGRTSRAVEVRAAELGIGAVLQGRADKLAAYRDLLAGLGRRPEQVCCVGDDRPVMRAQRRPACRHSFSADPSRTWKCFTSRPPVP